jgi:ribonucleoside-triphosphate reductase (thioredoxin)
MNDYQRYIAASRYARWNENESRRETWEETVERTINFWRNRLKVDEETLGSLKSAIINLEVMPSMRSLMSAGDALARDEIAGYNCSYVAIDNPKAFDEIMYILMCGTGVGFSVERQSIAQLPTIAEEFHDTDTTITVKDSRIGWAVSYRELISLLYSGRIPKWDVSKVRPSGARLRTFGGRASGPTPLEDLFKFTIETFKTAKGRKLNSLECHDIVCKVADIVVVGGVRRSALISLSNLTDERMRNAKSGQWWVEDVQRALANNSVAYTEKPDIGIFMREWQSLYESKSGERGIFNRVAATRNALKSGRRDVEGHHFGTNPCAEIVLRSMGLCNLSEVVVRSTDTFETLKRKVELATILGTMQSTLTNFRYLRSAWKNNAEEERLLGVSLTGIMDNAILSGGLEKNASPQTLTIWLEELKQYAISVNKEWAERLGITPSVAITTVKPSGTVSQLVDSSSGIHPRYSQYYIRTVRADNKDPLATFLKEQGVPNEPDVTKPEKVTVFSFPQKAPEGAVLRNDMTAIQQLEHYLIYGKHWAEHSVSITVYVREHEWLEVGAWVYKHFDELGGVSFLPHSDHSYKQAPYQEIDKDTYEAWAKDFPVIHWDKFVEVEDTLENTKELACVAGVCEI